MILEQIKKANLDHTVIFTGAGVDPDGLSSGRVMKAIVEKFGGKATVFHRGTFNRPQNKTMKEVLSLSIDSIDEINWTDYAYTCAISVDGPCEICPVWPDFLIDHHKLGKPAKIATDVRQIGSTSSMMWEYAMAAGINFDDEEGKKLATGIVIGILTDTDNFKEQSCADLDFKAAGFCLERKDYKSFLAIQNWPKPPYYSDMYSYGWERKTWEGTVLVAPLGDIPEGRSGIISDLAQKFAEHNGVNISVVVAMVEDEIVMSVRSTNSALDVKEFVKIFGAGGGKSGAGVATISLPKPIFSSANESDRKMVFDSFFSIILNKALEFAGDGARQTKAIKKLAIKEE